MIKNSFALCLVILGFSCASKDDGTQATLRLKVNECFDKFENSIRICLDSVVDDSRCPEGFECVWEGDAIAVFTLTKNQNVKSFNLHVNDKFQNDTLIDGFAIKLLNVSPYPIANQQINPDDYSVEIRIIEN